MTASSYAILDAHAKRIHDAWQETEPALLRQVKRLARLGFKPETIGLRLLHQGETAANARRSEILATWLEG